MNDNAEQYNFTEYPWNHLYFSESKKKVVGKFKDECKEHLISEFAGLRPKMCFVLEASGKNKMRAKGVSKIVVNKDLKHDSNEKCLYNQKEMKHTQVRINNQGHKIGVYEQFKASLSPFDNKKWISQGDINTRAYDHYACSA